MSDLISRAEAIKAIEDLQDSYNGFSDTYDKACIIGVLEELPSAEPQKGEWEPFDLTYGRHIFFCTACNNAAEVPTDFGKPMFKFCPWCGARMKTDDRD